MNYIPPVLPGRLLGIDAGGSATRVVLLTGGRLTLAATAPPVNALITPDLADRLLGLVKSADATAAGIGLPGIRTADRAARLAAELTSRAGIPVYVTGDGETGWLGAFGGQPGIVIYAGTGSGAAGSDGRRWARAGGHGFLLGDEGSAYWLGRAAASAALRWADGTGGSAALHDAVRDAAGVPLTDLVIEVNTHPAERSRLALFAPILTRVAETDAEALRIAREAAGYLADLAAAVRRRLGPLPVCGTGGVLSAPVIWSRFAELTQATVPLAPPETGAALLAGAPEAEFIRRSGGTLALAVPERCG